MILRRLLADRNGAGAAEFAMVLPVLLLLIFGTIDGGLYIWRLNEAEKAAQMAVRMAVVTSPVASGLTTHDYVGDTSCGTALTAGDTICAAALGVVSCSSSGSCSCPTTPCPALTRDSAAFDRIVAQAQLLAPWVQPSNVVVEYRGSGIGYAGGTGMDIAPLVTVKIQNATYEPLTALAFAASVSLPTISRTLPMEDGQGSVSS